MNKSATVHTDDPKTPQIVLHIAGTVEKFANINPKRLIFNGPVGRPLSTTVTISPLAKYPFTIKEVRARSGKDIRYRLEQTPLKKGPVYKLHVETTKEGAGRFSDMLVLETDSQIRPKIEIQVYGNFYSKLEKKKPASK